jgi:ubiquinone/menaquinone biosynthesis C-methylase UbiE
MTDLQTRSSYFHSFIETTELDPQSTFIVGFLDAMFGLDGMEANRRRTFDLLGVKSDSKVLDVACGSGNYLLDVARIVGEQGKAVGLDLSEALLGVAQTRAREQGVPIELHHGDATALPFPDNSFSGGHMERLLQYLPDPSAAINELKRVVRSGGCIVATEVDWGTIIFDTVTVDPDVWRRAVESTADTAGNGAMGRQLYRYFLQAGLDDVAVQGFVASTHDANTLLKGFAAGSLIERARDQGAITPDEATGLLAEIDQAATERRLFFAMTLFTASGIKPV